MAQTFQERFKNRNQKLTRLGIDNLECQAPVTKLQSFSPIKITAQVIINDNKGPKTALASSSQFKKFSFNFRDQPIQMMASYDNLNTIYKTQSFEKNQPDFSQIDKRISHEMIPQINPLLKDANEPPQLGHAKQGFFLSQMNSKRRKIQLYNYPPQSSQSEKQEVNLEFSKKPRYVNFEPYQVKDFQKLKNEQYKVSGLGSSTVGSEGWKEAMQKKTCAERFSKQVRLQNIQQYLVAHGQMNVNQ